MLSDTLCNNLSLSVAKSPVNGRNVDSHSCPKGLQLRQSTIPILKLLERMIYLHTNIWKNEKKRKKQHHMPLRDSQPLYTPIKSQM